MTARPFVGYNHDDIDREHLSYTINRIRERLSVGNHTNLGAHATALDDAVDASGVCDLHGGWEECLYTADMEAAVEITSDYLLQACTLAAAYLDQEVA